MSLGVTVKYKRPVVENYHATHACCGSTVPVYGPDHEEEVSEWHANITHNMCEMAGHIPVRYNFEGEAHRSTLYQMVWRPDKVGNGVSCCNTTVMEQVLGSGIAYMVLHRDELEKFNPENGWGSYKGFLRWLEAYWETCRRHPDCKIEVDR